MTGAVSKMMGNFRILAKALAAGKVSQLDSHISYPLSNEKCKNVKNINNEIKDNIQFVPI